jgi:integrase/recombinase XerD
MNVSLTPRLSRDHQKIFYSLAWGKNTGQRIATGIFTYAVPLNKAQERFNKNAFELLESTRLEMLSDLFVKGRLASAQKYEHNFLTYYANYVKRNKVAGNRHLECSFGQFQKFIGAKYISSTMITEELSFSFRRFLLERLNGETPANYFSRYKQVIKAATKQGYFSSNPCEDIPTKANRNKSRKDNLEVADYLKLLHTPITNEEVRDAFIFCCYTGLRWCDVHSLSWDNIEEDYIALHLTQRKTQVEHYITLHTTAKEILDKRKGRLVNPDGYWKIFRLPTANGSNKVLGSWCKLTAIESHITWSCARLSFSILLQDANVDAATVALLLGHTSSKYVNETYKRFRPKNQQEAIEKLPS